jgi:aerobic carbon-monoxide dehydrogenase large subunit
MAPQHNKWIGQSVTRLEDPPLVTGRACYAGDVSFPHQLHMRVVRSSIAHGRIISIDTRAAGAVPGVFAAWTAADIPDVAPIDFREGRIEMLEPFRQPVLARDRVRYIGDPIAVVFAEDPYVAEDAAELVVADFEELPVLLDGRAEPGEHSPGRNSEAAIVRQAYGELDVAFRAAHAIVELELTVGRHTGVPIETRGAIGRYDAARDVLELHGAAKIPHASRNLLARMLGRAPSAISLHEYHVGGGFGVRGEIYPEDVLVCVAAMRLARPVKWIEDRREHLMCASHSREQVHKIRAAIDAEGCILAIDDEFWHDQGAYLRTHAIRVAMMICGFLPGPYRVPAYRSIGHVRLTNKTPAATYRAPGRFETTFVRERLVDAIAARLGACTAEIRRRNAITKEEMPHARAMEPLGEEIHNDSGDYLSLLDKVLVTADWENLNAQCAKRRAEGEMVGLGLAMFVEKSGLGPSDGVKISVDTAGTVEVVTGGASIGQGFETVIAQVCAETLGLDYRRIRVIHGQTDRIGFGIGAHASRATVMTASATHNAALKVRQKALEYAAEMMQAPVGSLTIIDGRVVREDREAGASMSLGEIADGLAPASRTRRARDPGLSAEGWFHVERQVYPYGSHAAMVRVDGDTGAVAVERYVIGYDIGRAINPALVKGQIAGGFTQGIGGALFEEFLYNERGDPLSSTFADYLMPTIHETPNVEIILTEDDPSTLNPLGIKGAGESGINAVGATIAAAIDDAVGIPGAITQLPVSPHRLKEILKRNAARGR